ncbi:efflux RND transporter periplasmic adaptor subunit [Deinococcus psychrotolerans]|uniref:Efflux RND transporter periplasmic adaptor subunit n=1 Tax=Deinococcus psychrotolerans TaxID=2489213 RepID=A0A3G8YK05_9DEIO|nr:efflux RND transporter periplasmic adaptor subunit [Deinococcus psychrotolerans]AZI42854.1 efflux RND transporter periplasmic adaptor subunit [Deinococcus psychrotolerans]
MSTPSTAASRPAPQRKTRKIWPWIVAALLIGGGGAYWYQRTKTAQTPVVTVQTATAAEGEVKVSVSGPGTLQAATSSSVSATTGGTLTLVPTVGQSVTKGQLIAKLSSLTADTGLQNAQLALQKAQAQLASLRASQASSRAGDAQSVVSAQQSLTTAQSNLAAAQQTYANQQTIYAVGGISAQDLETARLGVQSAQSALSTAQQALSSARAQQSAKALSAQQDLSSSQLAVQQAQVSLQDAQTTQAGIKLYAPMSGTVATVPVSSGQSVTGSSVGGTVIATLIDASQIDLPVQIDETEIGAIKAGQQADVTLDALDGQTFSGKVIRISPQATTDSGIAYFTVTVQLPNPEGTLRPGMTAEAEIIQSQAQGLTVPKKAVEAVRTRSYVQLQAADGTAERTRVRTGADDGTNIIVTEGLKAGDVVVLPAGTVPSSPGGAGAARTGTPTRVPGVGGFGGGR